MATEPNTATIIQMPRRNKGRVRKSQSINSGGSMALADLDGPIPTNVVSLAKRRGFGGFEPPVHQQALLLSLAIFAVLPSENKNDLLRQIRILDYCAGDRRASAIRAIIDPVGAA